MKTIERTLCLEHGIEYFGKHKTHIRNSELVFDLTEVTMSLYFFLTKYDAL